jgi:hypothetical protein
MKVDKVIRLIIELDATDRAIIKEVLALSKKVLEKLESTIDENESYILEKLRNLVIELTNESNTNSYN